MSQRNIPLPTGFKVAEDYPKARERLVNCFNIGNNRILSRPGINAHTTGLGKCRGAEFYRNRLFHASGSQIIIVPEDSTQPIADLGEIGGADLVFFSEGHTMMMILNRGGRLMKWEDTGGAGTLTDVSANPNVGTYVDVAFMDGRWFYCPADGGPIEYSEVGDGGDIQPTNFFDAELLPDLNLGLINVRNTLYVLGEDSIELFRTRLTTNDQGVVTSVVGRVEGGQIQSGYIGGRIEFDVSFAYVGRNVDGHAGIFIAGSGRGVKISNDAVDDVLLQYSIEEISLVKSQRYTWHGMDILVFSFLNETLAYAAGEWHILTSDLDPVVEVPWRAVFSQYAYGRYFIGDQDTADIGILTDTDTDYGKDMEREITTYVREAPSTHFVVTALELDARMGLVETPGIVPDTVRTELHTASQWQIATDVDFTNIVYDSQETVTNLQAIVVPTDLDEDETYYWRVRHKGEVSGWSPYSTPTTFDTISFGVNPPINISPSQGSQDVVLGPTLNSSAFKPIGGAQTHTASQWQVATDIAFSNVVFDSGSDAVNLTNITVTPDLAEDTVYYWRVRHEGSVSGFSAYSSPTSFTTELVSGVQTPTNLTPIDTALDVSATPTLTGSMYVATSPTPPVQSHINSQWQVAEDAGFSTIVFDSGDDPVNLESIVVSPALETFKDYFWRTRYEGAVSGYSNYSASTTFKTARRAVNAVDASAPAWLRRGSGTSPFTTTAGIMLSAWVEYEDTSPTLQYLLGGALDSRFLGVTLTNTGLEFVVNDFFGVSKKSFSVPFTWVEGELYHIMVSSGFAADSTTLWINDVEVFDVVPTDIAGNWDTDSITQWAIFNRAQGTSGSASGWPKAFDFWVDDTPLDLSVEANRRKFIDANGDSVDLGVNGQLPTGVAPRIFFGSNYLATNWNNGLNLGLAGDFTSDVATGSNFTDA